MCMSDSHHETSCNVENVRCFNNATSKGVLKDRKTLPLKKSAVTRLTKGKRGLTSKDLVPNITPQLLFFLRDLTDRLYLDCSILILLAYNSGTKRP